jgi:hypothetical protein
MCGLVVSLRAFHDVGLLPPSLPARRFTPMARVRFRARESSRHVPERCLLTDLRASACDVGETAPRLVAKYWIFLNQLAAMGLGPACGAALARNGWGR